MAFASCSRIPAAGSKVTLANPSPLLRGPARVATCASVNAAREAPGPHRRAALLGLLSVPMLFTSPTARAEFIPLDDSRTSGAREAMESADQARDDRLDERRRFAFETLGKLSPNEHQERAKESYKRLSNDVKFYLDKKLLNRVSNELGLQIGNLRYDLEQIAASKDKGSRKAAQKESKQAIKALEQLDLYARLNKPSEANQAYSDALSKLGNIVKSYG